MQYTPQILLIVLGPLLFNYLLKGSKIGKVLSPVVMAYAVGIAAVTFGLIPLNEEISVKFSEISIMLAIPLLLFSSDIMAWFRHARSTVLSFFFAIIAAALSCIAVAYLFRNQVDTVWDYSAMLAGVYTGGTANMTAVHLAIEAPMSSFPLLNSVEMLCGGVYLLFLTSVAPLVFGKILPKYQYTAKEQEMITEPVNLIKSWKTIVIAVLLAIVVLAATLGSSYLIDGGIKNTTLIIIILTTISVGLSFLPQVRGLRGSFEAGDYLLLVFCIAAGMRSDFGQILEQGMMLLLFTATSWLLTVLIHLILSIIAKVDRDTTIITSVAALYGPAFIGQVASVLGNRQIVFAGIATGLVGYAIGNYLGISIHYLLYNWLA